ncbi:hypothetical protein [Rhizobium johnstonii]|uniref:hypothetical protein n=1 Tax=Rhizobium johnstonii TaxID=3019933 RepID=UPI002DDD5F53|nr:hypothetical protein U8P72_11985 [Rhizobium johnstonii]
MSPATRGLIVILFEEKTTEWLAMTLELRVLDVERFAKACFDAEVRSGRGKFSPELLRRATEYVKSNGQTDGCTKPIPDDQVSEYRSFLVSFSVALSVAGLVGLHETLEDDVDRSAFIDATILAESHVMEMATRLDQPPPPVTEV